MTRYKAYLAASLIALAATAYGQSLGDVARAQRDKQSQKPVAHKVVTDDDLPSHPADSKESSDQSKTGGSDSPAKPINTASNAAEVKAQFANAKQQISDYQAQLDKLRDSVKYVEANAYSNGAEYNQYQKRKQQEADRMQHQLDQARKKLQDMQEAARKAGFGSAVYDP